MERAEVKDSLETFVKYCDRRVKANEDMMHKFPQGTIKEYYKGNRTAYAEMKIRILGLLDRLEEQKK